MSSSFRFRLTVSVHRARSLAQQPKKQLTEDELHLLICSTEEKMLQAAANLDFELAAKLRDKLFELQGKSPEEIAEETVAVPQRKRRQRRSRYVKA